MLDQGQLDIARALARQSPPGRYTAKQLYGDGWTIENRPRQFGKELKEAVLWGLIPGLRRIGRRSDRSMVYEVFEVGKACDEQAKLNASSLRQTAVAH